jgi:predicted dehydrogenase
MSPNKKSKPRIRYAVVGLGHLAQVAVLPAFASAPNSELVAIVSVTRRSAGRLEKNISWSMSTRVMSTIVPFRWLTPSIW